MDLTEFIRDVPDFPKPGILFKDITPLLADPAALKATIDQLTERLAGDRVDRIVGIESRGFLFGTPLAIAMNTAFTPVRKPNKLPYKTHSVEYDLEYGTDMLEIHQDGIHPDERVVVVDDLLATGGTMEATCKLIELLGGRVVTCAFIVELAFLGGRQRLGDHRVEALIQYS